MANKYLPGKHLSGLGTLTKLCRISINQNELAVGKLIRDRCSAQTGKIFN